MNTKILLWFTVALSVAVIAAGCSLGARPSKGRTAAGQGQPAEEPALTEAYPRGELPAHVGQIKTLRVHGNQEKTDTGVDLTSGRLYSIMAKGRVFLDAADGGRDPSDPAFVKSIGRDFHGPVFFNDFGDTFVAIASGRLLLGIDEKRLADNTGHFDVVVVAWKTDDYARIADFLQKLHERNPSHPGILQAFRKADKVRNLTAARAATAREIEQTREKIRALQQPRALKELKPEERDERRRGLERTLGELTARQAQLEQVDQQLEQGREKASRLSRELETERRERERMSRLVAEGKTAPLLLVTAPEDGAQSESGSVRLTGAVEDDQGLASLEVFLNDRLLGGPDERGIRQAGAAGPRRVDFDRRVKLEEGENRLRVVATDTDGLTAEKTLTLRHDPKQRNVWAVIVGINDYPRLPKLKYAVNDARGFYRLLVEDNRVPAENVTLLLDEQASLVSLRSTLGTRLKNAARENDMVIIYFAGHGATERDVTSPDGDGLEKYLLPFDTDPADLYTTALPMVEIARIFNRIRSERLVFIADACYSGASGGRTISISGVRAGISEGFLERVASGRGKVILTASAPNEVSLEKDELEHGVFTYYLLEGLRGPADTDRDGMVSVEEAYRYVTEKVPPATGQEQHPVKKGSVEGTLVLSLPRR
jgi:uncharacterized caspase-like protein